MTNSKQDFIGAISATKTKIRGINGLSQACYVGTVKWSFEDSNGRRHDHLIPGTYYCADLPCRYCPLSTGLKPSTIIPH
jgi:hypothetical protein